MFDGTTRDALSSDEDSGARRARLVVVEGPAPLGSRVDEDVIGSAYDGYGGGECRLEEIPPGTERVRTIAGDRGAPRLRVE
ncbi:MAG: hypothetical protein AAGD92_17160, partial [Pseudomonadota bacterium]